MIYHILWNCCKEENDRNEKNQKYIGLGKNTNIFKKCISVKLFITFLFNIVYHFEKIYLKYKLHFYNNVVIFEYFTINEFFTLRLLFYLRKNFTLFWFIINNEEHPQHFLH